MVQDTSARRDGDRHLDAASRGAVTAASLGIEAISVQDDDMLEQ